VSVRHMGQVSIDPALPGVPLITGRRSRSDEA
jgi:hypothetical protein